jgi:hypothetical protein
VVHLPTPKNPSISTPSISTIFYHHQPQPSPANTRKWRIELLWPLKSINGIKNRKLSALARDFAVSYYQLRRKAQGVSSRIGNQNRPRLLTEAQEQAIMRTIDRLRRYNFKLNGKDIEDCANLLLWRQYERDHPEAKMPKTNQSSHAWLSVRIGRLD